jgi:hypothetical protein
MARHIGYTINFNLRLLSFGSTNFLILFSIATLDMIEKNIDHSIISFIQIMKREMSFSQHSNSQNAIHLTKVLIASRLLYFLIQKEIDPNLSPRNFLISQLNGNSKFANEVFLNLYEEDLDVDALLIELKVKLEGTSLSIALDEAHAFEIDFEFIEKFKSPNNRSRGLLSPFNTAINQLMDLTLIKFTIYAGTSLSIVYADVIISGSKQNVQMVNNFVHSKNLDSFFQSLSKIFSITKNDLNLIHKDHYIGRIKFTFYSLKYIPKFLKEVKKDKILGLAFKESFHEIFDQILEKLENNISSDLKIILKEMNFLILRKEKYFQISTPLLTKVDLIDIGIITLHRFDKYSWNGIIEEPILMEIMLKLFDDSYFDKIFPTLTSENFDHLYRTLINFGKNSSEKGKSFEYFILNSFLNPEFKGKMKNIPIIKNSIRHFSKVPKWLERNFSCKEVLISESVKNDLDVLDNHSKLYLPSNSMGPDGILVVNHILFTIGVKCSTTPIENKIVKKNYEKCLIDNFYSQKEFIEEHSKVFERFKNFEEKIQGKVIVLVEYPSPKTVQKSNFNPKTNTITIFLNESNLGDLIDSCYLEPLKLIMIKETKHIKPYKCSICGVVGHNKRTCNK